MLAPVSIQLPFEGTPPAGDGVPFDVMAPSGERLLTASVAATDLANTRERWRLATWSLMLTVVALTLLLLTAPLLDWRNRQRAPSGYAVAVPAHPRVYRRGEVRVLRGRSCELVGRTGVFRRCVRIDLTRFAAHLSIRLRPDHWYGGGDCRPAPVLGRILARVRVASSSVGIRRRTTSDLCRESAARWRDRRTGAGRPRGTAPGHRLAPDPRICCSCHSIPGTRRGSCCRSASSCRTWRHSA